MAMQMQIGEVMKTSGLCFFLGKALVSCHGLPKHKPPLQHPLHMRNTLLFIMLYVKHYEEEKYVLNSSYQQLQNPPKYPQTTNPQYT
jgi:hypothetical protein